MLRYTRVFFFLSVPCSHRLVALRQALLASNRLTPAELLSLVSMTSGGEEMVQVQDDGEKNRTKQFDNRKKFDNSSSLCYFHSNCDIIRIVCERLGSISNTASCNIHCGSTLYQRFYWILIAHKHE